MDISHVISVKETEKLMKISVPNYVPGRKLTSDDLQHERDAALKHLEIVGRAAGTGIIEGLWVSALGSNQLTVSAGMGINITGHPIVLEPSITLELASLSASTTEADTAFGPCKADLKANTGQLHDGPYLLTAIPVSRLSKDMTTAARILPNRKIEDCVNLWKEESINFRAVFLGNTLVSDGFNDDIVVPQGATPDVINKLNMQRRNLLAHWAFGTKNLMSLVRDPFNRWNNLDYSGFGVARGGFEKNSDLTDCDLKLAVFYLETNEKNVQSIQFVDNWAVRRRPYQPSQFPVMPATSGGGVAGWSQRTNDQLAAEGEARFAQFQEQLDDLRQAPNFGRVNANQYFRYLPSAGYLPLAASPMLCQIIAQFVVDLFLEEAQEYNANPVYAQIDWTPLSLLSLSSDKGRKINYDPVLGFQMTNLIEQLNTVLGNISQAVNIWSQGEIWLDLVNANFGIDNNSPVLYTTFPFIRKEINSKINAFSDYITKLWGELGCDDVIELNQNPVQGIEIDGENSEVTSTDLSEICIIPLNELIARFVNILNLIGSNPLVATNPFYTRVRNELSSILNKALFPQPVLAPAANGVQVENFFLKDQRSTNLKTLGFTDRQSIETLLQNSWQAPAIDLTVDQNLSLILVYEDVIPYAAEQLKNIIQGGVFSDTWGNFQQIWCAGVSTTFENIIARKSIKRPPLYGLFTQAVYPLQTSV